MNRAGDVLLTVCLWVSCGMLAMCGIGVVVAIVEAVR